MSLENRQRSYQFQLVQDCSSDTRTIRMSNIITIGLVAVKRKFLSLVKLSSGACCFSPDLASIPERGFIFQAPCRIKRNSVAAASRNARDARFPSVFWTAFVFQFPILPCCVRFSRVVLPQTALSMTADVNQKFGV